MWDIFNKLDIRGFWFIDIMLCMVGSLYVCGMAFAMFLSGSTAELNKIAIVNTIKL